MFTCSIEVPILLASSDLSSTLRCKKRISRSPSRMLRCGLCNDRVSLWINLQVYNIHSTWTGIQYTLYMDRYTIYTLHGQVYNIHSTWTGIQYTLYMDKYTIYTLHGQVYMDKYSIKQTAYHIYYTCTNTLNSNIYTLHRLAYNIVYMD